MPEGKLKSAIVLCNVPTANSGAAIKFYDTLLGEPGFVPAPVKEVTSFFREISKCGLNLVITDRQDAREMITCYFAVDNLDEALRELKAAGGKEIVRPTEVPGPDQPTGQGATKNRKPPPTGRMATMLDPDGNYIGLIQLEGKAKSYFEPQ